MKVRKVSAALLDSRSRANRRAISPREQRRIDLEAKLEQAIRGAAADPMVAFRLDLEDSEKPPTVRLAFTRVRDRTGATEVNLFTRNGVLIVANRPQVRGRRPRS